jgi:hypothetical protein
MIVSGSIDEPTSQHDTRRDFGRPAWEDGGEPNRNSRSRRRRHGGPHLVVEGPQYRLIGSRSLRFSD